MDHYLAKKTFTILNVDDNDDARRSLSWLLKRHGFEVWEAATGKEALQLMERHPDLVLLDVILPDHNGLEICRKIKADSGTANIPVLMLSGLAISNDDRIHGLTGGADEYLTKPVNLEVVVAHAKALIRIRQAEGALRRGEARWRAIIENSFDALVLVGADGLVQYASPSCMRSVGYTSEELSGRDIFEMVHAEDLSSMRDEFQRQLKVAGSTVIAFYRARHKDGSWRWLETRRTNLLNDPDVAALVTNFRDITEQRKAEEHLRQSQKMEAVGRLAGGIAHDFNNLLTVINGYGELASNELPTDHPVREMVAEMTKAGVRAAELTQQLLAYSRKSVLAPKLLDVNAVVKDMERLLRRLINEDIVFTVLLQPNLGYIHADPGHFEQVILNLAVNARDAMPQGGKLMVETKRVELDRGYAAIHPGLTPGNYVMFAVTDTGCGMSPDVLTHMFEPFFTTKEVGKGTGLGLAAVQGVVKQSGGHITVYSEPGVGTTFKVYLPQVEPYPSCVQASAGIRDAPRGSETVLLVEDEEAVRSLGIRVLKSCGYTVLKASDGHEAIQVAIGRGAPIHLLITDVVMPGMGGREVAERIHLLGANLKVLYISGYTEDAVVRHGILESQVNFLQKPFTPLALAQKVREVLDAVGAPQSR